MYCQNCGNEIKGNAKFCAHCGNAVVDMEADSQNNPVKNKKPLLWLGVAGIVVLVAVCVIFFVRNNNPVNMFNKYLEKSEMSKAASVYAEAEISDKKAIKEFVERELESQFDKYALGDITYGRYLGTI